MTTSQLRCLSEYESKNVLRKYNIPLAKEALVIVLMMLIFADAGILGYESGLDIPHKTDAGLCLTFVMRLRTDGYADTAEGEGLQSRGKDQR